MIWDEVDSPRQVKIGIKTKSIQFWTRKSDLRPDHKCLLTVSTTNRSCFSQNFTKCHFLKIAGRFCHCSIVEEKLIPFKAKKLLQNSIDSPASSGCTRQQ